MKPAFVARRLLAVSFLVLPFAFPAESRSQANELSIPRIYKSEEFLAEDYSVNWMPEGGRYHVQSPSEEGPGDDILLVDPFSGQSEVLIKARALIPDDGTIPVPVSSFSVSPDGNRVLVFTNTRRVWRYNTRGDYYVADRNGGKLRKLGGKDSPEASLMFAKFSPDSSQVAWVRDCNIYVEELESGAITCLTTTESADIINGTSDWVYEEELDLRDGFRWSDDGKYLIFWRFDTSEVGVFTMINNTAALYPVITRFQYPKTGTTNSSVTIGICNLADRSIRYLDLPGDPRDHYPARINVIPGTSNFLLQRLNRLQNTNSVYEVDSASAGTRLVFEDKDEAWVEVCDQIEWIDGNRKFTFISESDGWRHVWLVDLASGERELLTPGDFDVIELYHLDAANRTCLFQATPDKPTDRYLFRQAFGSANPERLTPENQPGFHEYSVAADGSAAVHTWSQFGVPPVVETIRLPGHESIKVHTDNSELRDALRGLEVCQHEFFRVDVRHADGTEVAIDGWAMKPPQWDATAAAEGKQKWPVIVYVYGEPWGTTVTNQWEGEDYLWHRMLCEKGYVVISLDNRGAKVPRGAAWRKAIYKLIGTVNAADQAAALQETLRRFPWLDADRVGIWGWSGGGTSTLNALFKYPELYHTGISVAPVPDERYYDTIYQERYMQTPELNPEGYHNGSAIHNAKNLKGNLLVIHGTGDDNCHYQTVELLIDELIRHDKQFTMFAYPNRSHGIYEYENTTPHLRRLMLDFFIRNLPPGMKDG